MIAVLRLTLEYWGHTGATNTLLAGNQYRNTLFFERLHNGLISLNAHLLLTARQHHIKCRIGRGRGTVLEARQRKILGMHLLKRQAHHPRPSAYGPNQSCWATYINMGLWVDVLECHTQIKSNMALVIIMIKTQL